MTIKTEEPFQRGLPHNQNNKDPAVFIMLRPHLDVLLFEEDSTGEDTGLMGDDVPVAMLGEPAVVKECARLEGRGLGGAVMAFASVRVKDRKDTMTSIVLNFRNQTKPKWLL